jgi:Leucine-rich repeat (LRR) protein
LLVGVAAGLGILVAGLAVYYIADYFRYFGSWQLVDRWDFTRPQVPVHGIAGTDPSDTHVEPVQKAGTGVLRLNPQVTYWLTDLRERGDVRIEMRVRWPEHVDGLEININARREKQPVFWYAPAGYLCQFGGYNGSISFISRNEQCQAPNTANASGSQLVSGRVYKLQFQRLGDVLSLYVDQHCMLQVIEPVPIAGDSLDMIAVRSWADLEVFSLNVWRMGSAYKTSPLVAGDALVRYGSFDNAVKEYMRIASDHAGSRFAPQALLRAYMLAGTHPGTSDTVRRRIRNVMEQQYSRSPYWPRLLEADCEQTWRSGAFDSALTLAAMTLDNDPSSRIALRMLVQRPEKIPPHAVSRPLELIGRTTGVTSLDIKDLGVVSLEPLKGMRLVSLNCSRNTIADLSPLEGMPLRLLTADENDITQVQPLSGMPLEILNLNYNKVADLSPLRECPVRELAIGYNRIVSLEPLSGMQLEEIDIAGNAVQSLEPLRGMPMRKLVCADNRISDLSPLEGMPLKELLCSDNSIKTIAGLTGSQLTLLNIGQNHLTDLEPLRGLPLRDLEITGNAINDLTPLAGMQLNTFSAYDNEISSLEPLRGMPLRILEIWNNSISSLVALGDMPLTKLDVSNNLLTGLSPLKGASLEHLACFGNPLVSLAPFEADPPRWMWFDSVNADKRYINSVLDHWTKHGDSVSARTSAALIAFRRGFYGSLRDFSVPYEERRYLFLPQLFTFAQARELAEVANGHMVTLTHRAENEFVMSLMPPETGIWLGLIRDEHDMRGDRWCTGETLDYTDFGNQAAIASRKPVQAVVVNANPRTWYAIDDTTRLRMVIEWE